MMSGHSVAAFMTTLRRFDRRLRLRTFLRYVPFAVAIAIAMDAAFASFVQIDSVAILVGSSLVLAVLAAYGLAVSRTASLSATARIVDRELKLQDRTTSALEFLHGTDAVSRLVVADATARLESLPVSSLPLTVSRSARWAAALTAISALLVITMLSSSRHESRADAISFGSASPGRASADVDGGSARSSAVRRATSAASDSHESRVATPSSDLRAAPPGGAAAEATAQATAPNTGRRDVARSNEDAPSAEEATSAAPGPTDPRSGSDSGANSRKDARANTPAGTTATSALLARGQGAKAPSTAHAGGGGIGGGAVVDTPAGIARSTWAGRSGRQSAAYAAAYARAEAALPTERIPVSLRSYVRAYFVAIRPSPHQ